MLGIFDMLCEPKKNNTRDWHYDWPFVAVFAVLALFIVEGCTACTVTYKG